MDPCIVCGCPTEFRNDFDEPVCEDCLPEEEGEDIDDDTLINLLIDSGEIDQEDDLFEMEEYSY